MKPRRGVSYFVIPRAAVVQVEMRKAVRYRLDLPVTFRWTAASGGDCLGMGFTRDISSTAMFVLCEHCPPADAYISCEVMLSRPENRGYCQIIGSGRVLRSEQNGQRRGCGFALLGDMLLLDSELIDARAANIKSGSPFGNRNVSN